MPALVALTIAGAALRFATLDVQGYWYDEAITVSLVGSDLGGMLGRIPESESTPPLYYLLAWAWSKLFGTGEVGLRSLSALFGTAAIPAFWAAARELTDSQRVALVVAALTAFNPLLVWYSQEARAYSLLALLCALSLLCFARALRRPGGRALAGWAVFSALALASHYFAAFLVIPEAVWLARKAEPRRAATLALGGVGLAVLALAPLALYQRSLDLASFIRESALPYRLARTMKQYVIGFDAPLEAILTVVAAVILVAGAAVALHRRGEGVTRAALLGALALLVPLALAGLGLDYFDTRNVLPAWLPLAVVCASGLALSRAGVAGAAALCAIGLAAAIAVPLEPLWQRDDWRGVVQDLGPARSPRVVVASPGGTVKAPLSYYLEGEREFVDGAEASQIAVVSTSERSSGDVHPPEPPRGRNLRFSGFRLVRRIHAENYTVLLYETPRAAPQRADRLDNARLIPREPAVILLQEPG